MNSLRFSSVLLASIFVILAGCLPRGETKTLEQILAASHTKYQSQNQDGLNDAVAMNLKLIDQKIDSLLSADGTLDKDALSKVGVALWELTSQAGFTSRPAMNELSLQYRHLGSAEGTPATDQVKLLASRTYDLLSSELATTRFRNSISG